MHVLFIVFSLNCVKSRQIGDADRCCCVSGARHGQEAHGGAAGGEPDASGGPETEHGRVSASWLGTGAALQDHTRPH